MNTHGSLSVLLTEIRPLRLETPSVSSWLECLASVKKSLDEALATYEADEAPSGDVFQWTFANPENAVRAAIAVFETIGKSSLAAEFQASPRAAVYSQSTFSEYVDLISLIDSAHALLDLAHPEQVLVSEVTHAAVLDASATDFSFQNLGTHVVQAGLSLEQVYQLESPGLPNDFPPTLSLARIPNNLPLYQRGVVDREILLRETIGHLHASRIVTLVGHRGVGKSTVARRVPTSMLYEFRDGLYLVDLSTYKDDAFLIEAVAIALGYGSFKGVDLLTSLKQRLGNKRILLVLDNCDGVLSGISELARELVQSCSSLEILATSRTPLRVPGELVVDVPPLDVPQFPNPMGHIGLGEPDALRLLLQSAQRLGEHFVLNEGDQEVCIEICQLLRGSPFCTELVGAMLATESPYEVRDQLLSLGLGEAQTLSDILTKIMGWVCEALTEQERYLLLVASIFADYFTSEALKYVSRAETSGAADFEKSVLALRSKGLIEPLSSRPDATRYKLPEPLRRFSLEKVVESGRIRELRNLHSQWYADQIEDLAAQIGTMDEAAVLDEFDLEKSNLRLALETSLLPQGNKSKGFRMIFAACHFWYRRSYLSEGRVWSERMLAASDFAISEERARGLNVLGWFALAQGDFKSAQAFLHHALTMARTLRSKWLIASIQANLGHNCFCLSDFDNAEKAFRESTNLWKELENEVQYTKALNNLAGLMSRSGRPERALPVLTKALSLAQEQENEWTEAIVLFNLAMVHYRLKDTDLARSLFRQALQKSKRLKDYTGIANTLSMMSRVSELTGAEDRAVVLLGAAASIRERASVKMAPVELEEYEQVVTELNTRLGARKFEQLWTEGRSYSMDAALEFALQDQ